MDHLADKNYTYDDIINLYPKYDAELRLLSRKLRGIYHAMQKKGHGTTFSDVEGELLYLLIREGRPNVVFEISPDCGWSTNYILAALTANQHGVLHTFELETKKHGQPTETVITTNQHPDWDKSRLILHLGDARDTVKEVGGEIDFLLMDSNHEDWFADWYLKEMLPRVRGPVMVHDIVFVDGMEPSTEARFVWEWAGQKGVELNLVGALEAALQATGLRATYAERRNLRCNSIFFSMPEPKAGSLPELAQSPEELLDQAEKLEGVQADDLVNQAAKYILTDTKRVHRHRLLYRAGRVYLRMGEPGEAERQFQRALGVVLQADRLPRYRGLTELFRLFLSGHQWRHALQTGLMLCVSRPDGIIEIFRVLAQGVSKLWRNATNPCKESSATES